MRKSNVSIQLCKPESMCQPKIIFGIWSCFQPLRLFNTKHRSKKYKKTVNFYVNSFIFVKRLHYFF